MAFLLPLLFLILSTCALRGYVANVRTAFLSACVITAGVLTFLTELLSLSQAFSFAPLMTAWILMSIAVALWWRGRRAMLTWPQVDFKSWLLSEKIFLGIIIFIGLVSFVTATFGMPNTWDSMTYHLPRVEHWIQNRSVAYYPTNIIRQDSYSPWAEFAIAHVRLLGGGASSANFIQWTAMMGSLVAVSLIAGQLGANRTGQLAAAAMAACLPMGILESVSTQTDYVCAFWMCVFVFFLIEARRRAGWIFILGAGLSLGLACLTKANSYIFAAPFLVSFLIGAWKEAWGRALKGFVLIMGCVLVLNMGPFLRNASTFGSPVWTNIEVTNSAFDGKVLWVNLLRNMSIHWATPWPETNETIKQFLTTAAGWLGADINDPRASFTADFTIAKTNYDEDYAGNFFHAIVFVIVFILAWFYRPLGQIRFYMLSVFLAFLLFCLVVRYQPWHSRFHLPLFVLFCPAAGAVLGQFLKQKSILVGVFLFAAALPFLFLNIQHPWAGQLSIWKQPATLQYFYKRPALALPSAEISAYVKSTGCRQVGLSNGEDDWEYPWWVLLKDQHIRLEHVEVGNPSGRLKYPLGDFDPCIVIAPGADGTPFEINHSIYQPAGSIPVGSSKIVIFLKNNT